MTAFDLSISYHVHDFDSHNCFIGSSKQTGDVHDLPVDEVKALLSYENDSLLVFQVI